jgi:hypothetical protein
MGTGPSIGAHVRMRATFLRGIFPYREAVLAVSPTLVRRGSEARRGYVGSRPQTSSTLKRLWQEHRQYLLLRRCLGLISFRDAPRQ